MLLKLRFRAEPVNTDLRVIAVQLVQKRDGPQMIPPTALARCLQEVMHDNPAPVAADKPLRHAARQLLQATHVERLECVAIRDRPLDASVLDTLGMNLAGHGALAG